MPLTPTPAGPPYALDRPTLARQVRIDTFRASGPGGQHLQRTESAVRLTHLPSGVVVIASDTRSQIRNRAIAFERLAERLPASRPAPARPRKNEGWKPKNTGVPASACAPIATRNSGPLATCFGPWMGCFSIPTGLETNPSTIVKRRDFTIGCPRHPPVGRSRGEDDTSVRLQ